MADDERHALDLLGSAASRAGEDLDQEKLSAFRTYLELLLFWGGKINIIGPSSREGIVRELFLDCFEALRFYPKEGRYLDIGSGAGIPAVPIKIMRPCLELHLIEARRKRVSFLKEVSRRLPLTKTSVMEGRLGDKTLPLPQASYDRVTARAFADLPKMVSICAPLARRGGAVICFQGPNALKELEEARRCLGEAGLSVEEMRSYRIQGKARERIVTLLRKA